MKVKSAYLIDAALDWAVGTALKLPVEICQIFQYGRPNGQHYISIGETDKDGAEVAFEPSKEWSQGGPIIEWERVELLKGNLLLFVDGTREDLWIAKHQSVADRHPNGVHGPTPLIAAMRCYVASILGDEIEIPEELLK